MSQEEFEKQYLEAQDELEKILMKFGDTNEVADQIEDHLWEAFDHIGETVAEENGFEWWDLKFVNE